MEDVLISVFPNKVSFLIIKNYSITSLAASSFLLASLILSGCSRAPETITAEHTVSSGEMLSVSLGDNGIPPATIAEISRNLEKVFNLRRSREGDYYRVVISTAGMLITFSYYPQRGFEYYEILRGDDGKFTASVRDMDVKTATMTARGLVKSSLWEAMSSSGMDGELIIRFAELFSSQVDFLTDTREGDEFKIIWTEKTAGADSRKRRIIEKIVAAEYVNRSEKFTAVGFGNGDLDYDYYTPDGKSLRLAFLRAPLSYRRISSHFSRKRFHPVLRIYRPHHGIDYVAPAGTPVSSIGDGTVVFKGWSGGYGNLVRIRHPNGYETYYGHLSRFAKIARGTRVRQGQVIGYVGSTGISTGPHLHFEIRSGRAPMNFLALRLPSQKQVPQPLRADFEHAVAEAQILLNEIR